VQFSLENRYGEIIFIKKQNSIGDAKMNEPLHITDAEFEEKVLKADVPVIVDFWAPWCGPCRMIAPILDKVAKAHDGKLLVAKVNTDENVEWAQKYNVRGIPTMLFVNKGEIIHQQVGALPEGMMMDAVNQFLESVPAAE
jgi:thioredoxin 1